MLRVDLHELLPPPRRVETTIFTRLPVRFRKSRPSAWADANRGCLEIYSFLEGPSFNRRSTSQTSRSAVCSGLILPASGNRLPSMMAGRTD